MKNNLFFSLCLCIISSSCGCHALTCDTFYYPEYEVLLEQSCCDRDDIKLYGMDANKIDIAWLANYMNDNINLKKAFMGNSDIYLEAHIAKYGFDFKFYIKSNGSTNFPNKE